MKKTIITILSLSVVLIVVVYAYEFILGKPIIELPVKEDSVLPVEKNEIKEQDNDSSYTFTGILDLPTPCHTYTSKINKISNFKYQIQINTVSPKQDTNCAQVVTPKPYDISFNARKDTITTILIDGIEYETNRFQIPSIENNNSFILEIKR